MKRNFGTLFVLASATMTASFCLRQGSLSRDIGFGRSVSLSFLNKEPKHADFFEKSKEIVIPPEDVMISPQEADPGPIEHSHPTVDQEARWMEEEALMEGLSIFVVFAFVSLAGYFFHK